MGIYSSAYLKDLFSTKKRLFEQELISLKQTPINTKFDIFLSHSFLDREEVFGLFQELSNFGYLVYVDWIVDPNLNRERVTKESATLIRQRMKCSKSLLLAVSTNVTLSKWIPWELGYVDGNTNRCAIVPISNETTPPKSFKGTEYLSLYPFIKRASKKGTNVDKLWVITGEHDYSVFESWLNDGIIIENRPENIFDI